jgi:hypothetical protein
MTEGGKDTKRNINSKQEERGHNKLGWIDRSNSTNIHESYIKKINFVGRVGPFNSTRQQKGG